jgi:hypothetical protein
VPHSLSLPLPSSESAPVVGDRRRSKPSADDVGAAELSQRYTTEHEARAFISATPQRISAHLRQYR